MPNNASLAGRRWVPALFAATVVGVAACSERLDGGAGCPILCPDQISEIRDTVLDAVSIDTTLAPFPSLGSEPSIFLATRGPAGDTLQTYGVVRYDSLATTYVVSGDTTPITQVDSTYVMIRVDTLNNRTDRIPLKGVNFDLYDVDTTAADTNFAALAALIRPDRRVGGAVNLRRRDVVDSVKIPLDPAFVLSKITAKKRIRLAVRVSSATEVVQLRIGASDAGRAPLLRYDPSPDTAVHPVTLAPHSLTPADQPVLAAHLADFTLVTQGSSPADPGLLSVGGIPGRRTYLRFAVPRSLLDSTTIVRATLLLTQRPQSLVDPRDTLAVYTQLVLAGARITNLAAAARILAPPGTLVPDTVRLAASDTGVHRFELVSYVRQWRVADTTDAPQAIVLRSSEEGTLPLEAVFYSSSADDPERRPRLRIAYVPLTTLGLP